MLWLILNMDDFLTDNLGDLKSSTLDLETSCKERPGWPTLGCKAYRDGGLL